VTVPNRYAKERDRLRTALKKASTSDRCTIEERLEIYSLSLLRTLDMLAADADVSVETRNSDD